MNDPILQENIFWALRCANQPCIVLLGYHQIPRRNFWRTKKLWVKMVIIGSFPRKQINFGQGHMKKLYIPKNLKIKGMLVQKFKWIAQETTLVDPLKQKTCQNVITNYILLTSRKPTSFSIFIPLSTSKVPQGYL